MHFGAVPDDPLSFVLAPPPNETPEQLESRLKAEQEAKQISDEIDEALKAERSKRRAKPLRILLLGQSESGKSTTLKNFQIMYTPKAFKAERSSWRAVIQLNLVRSFRTILDTLSAFERRMLDLEPGCPPIPELTPEQRKLKMRLAPLLQVEDQLMRKLAGPNEVEAIRRSAPVEPWDVRTLPMKEISVSAGWKDSLMRFLPSFAQGPSEEDQDGLDDPNDPRHTIFLCRDDMKALWADGAIRSILVTTKIFLEQESGFFLNELDRVTELRYVPSDDDVLRARLKTVGVYEYQFTMETSTAVAADWRIIDVGGLRSQRLYWASFFDSVDAIIFLAPISCFDQVLAEDRSVNRLEDSVLLWKKVCSNALLANVQIVLFLNKVDLFRAKLEAGVQLSRYVTTYAPRMNDAETASAYLRRKFASIQKETSPQPRQFYCHLTAVIDTKATSIILARVGDMVVRSNLRDSNLI